MSRLPTLTPKKVAAALLRAGFVFDNQTGSHLALCHPETKRETTVPLHPGDIDRGLLKKIIKQVGLTEEEFRKLL